MVEYWEETITLLQPPNGYQLVTKPHMKPDLLQKVPFKFLHDVITAILKRTNFASGIYSADQLNRRWDGFDKDKVGKEANQNRRKFLSDILAVVSFALEEEIQCDVKEVLRGKDAPGANRLLQNLAKASSTLQLDGAEAVQVLKKMEEGQADAEAQRPESRRAPKPTRAADAETDASAGQPRPAEIVMPPVQTLTSDALDQQMHGNVALDTKSTDGSGRQRPPSHGSPMMQPVVDRHQASASLNKPSVQQTLESTLADVPHGVTEALANAAASPQMRPLTAKKAPPLRGSPAPVKQRSRLQPPEHLVSCPGKQQGVHVFWEESAREEESVDVLESELSVQSSAAHPMHGVLVSEMHKAKTTADAAQVSKHDEASGMLDGITLGRSKRSKQRSGLHVDLSLTRQAVEKLVQQITPLSRTMEYLQEDKENMEKELQVWRTEASKWCEQLANEVQAHSLLDTSPVTSIDEQIEKHKFSIKQLQRQILLNNEKIAGMVHLVIGYM